jgi:hypothetical protein
MKALGDILSAMSSLKHLGVYLTVPLNALTALEHLDIHIYCFKLDKRLSAVQDTLKSLNISMDFTSSGFFPDAQWGPFNNLPSLPSFKKVKSLQICPELILGNDEEFHFKLCERLPPSLESLHFTCADWWAMPPYHNVELIYSIVDSYVASLEPGNIARVEGRI